ncbi:hypothetical protein EDEG_02100 [Edhazardia aedis USNM 41457]|uniref:Uncharacterized protein n=1 Tax=Edhazardia aedis (strain USNM 41457) TaxID=1003232 RepID=J8ZVD1_EDHAE|nr:hypothetical protein EDEG_02100 [Edhazardia aedis USNM 41457]|eukprot:EJW03588.1 hypothetical protein EDEG_02100 [Edhazardia aedis USNM 41457]
MSNALMYPIIYIFRYVYMFDKLQQNCFMKLGFRYRFLIYCFKDILRMVNNKMNKTTNDDFLNSIIGKLSNKTKFVHDYKIYDCGVLKFYAESDMKFRNEDGKFILLFYNNSMQLFLNENNKINYIDTIRYFSIRKCKVYEEGSNFLVKIVFYAQSSKEIFVFQVDSRDKAERIVIIINDSIHNFENVHDNLGKSFAKNLKYTDIGIQKPREISKTSIQSFQNPHNKSADKIRRNCSREYVNYTQKNNDNLEIHNDTRKSKETVNSRKSELIKHFESNLKRNNKLYSKPKSETTEICDEDILQHYSADQIQQHESPQIVVKIEFGKLLLLTIVNLNESLESFKRKLISEIGRNLFDDTYIDEKYIDLNIFNGYFFYIRENDKLYHIKSDQSLKAALFLAKSDRKMEIVVKKEVIDGANHEKESV